MRLKYHTTNARSLVPQTPSFPASFESFCVCRTVKRERESPRTIPHRTAEVLEDYLVVVPSTPTGNYAWHVAISAYEYGAHDAEEAKV